MRGRVVQLAGPVAGAGDDAVAGRDRRSPRRPGSRPARMRHGPRARASSMCGAKRGMARSRPRRRPAGKPFRVADPAGRRYERPMPSGGSRADRQAARTRGVASRRVAETMIAAGRVAVNGRVIDSPALNVTAADPVDGRRQGGRGARGGAALALPQAGGPRDHRARREGPRHRLRPPPGGHAAGGLGRPARPHLRGAAAPDQRRRDEAAARAALDRLAAQLPGARPRRGGRRGVGAAEERA